MRNRKSLVIFIGIVLFLASQTLVQALFEGRNNKAKGGMSPETFLLLQAHGEPEVFVIIEGIKHWIQNPKTASILGYDVSKRKIVSLDEVNKYPTGETFNKDRKVSTCEARDIYFPEKLKPYPFRGLRGLLTLNPKPENGQVVEDLGFNAVMPYVGVVPGWKGDLISVPDRDNVILLFTADEPDCRKQNPEVHLNRYKMMKDETPDIPVGLVLCPDIGCGFEYEINGRMIVKEDWLKVANQVDFVMCGIYTYHERYPDAMKELEKMEKRLRHELKVPLIPILQAHWGITAPDGNKLLKPNAMEQVKFWFDRGYKSYVVYCWSDKYHGVRDAQEEWKKANEWAKKAAG